ncbi:MAG TPA: hypothetical protein VGM60_10445 [Pseudonocardia sp.]|uniref:hypothetical protein n=1 Tax=Pseudonocardia sp. TaxID=60912 RepID=UPI002F41994A
MADETGKNSAIESAVGRIRELNERIVNVAKEGGEESVRTYERVLENLAEAVETAGERGAEWIQEFARTQAAFTRRLAEAFPALLERLGVQSREAADEAKAKIREVPELAEAEGVARGALSREQDLPIAGYDDLNVEEISSQLEGLSLVELGRVEAYEARTKNRKTVHDRISTLRQQ